jgi:hypothetical protein
MYANTLRHCYKRILIIYGKIFVFYSENQLKPINALCERHAEL